MSAVMNDCLPRPRITVDEYYRMAEVGLLAPDVRRELIEGEIIEMAPMGSRHAGKVGQLSHLIFPTLRHSAQLRVQLSVRLCYPGRIFTA
jgi:Uma2 family endonuclease